jgi:hypothetical protein
MKPRAYHAVALLFLAPGAPALAQSESCLLFFPKGLELPEYTCTCGPGLHTQAIWGSGTYTGDSHLCTAAVHAGVIGPEGGEITVMVVPAPDEYRSTTANGVTSRNWEDPYDFAIVFEGAPEVEPLPICGPLGEATELACHCPGNTPVGSAWGSNPYTADSDICAAARHAGVINHRGGQVTVQRVDGQESYTGSMAWGITTSDHGSADASMTFTPVFHGETPAAAVR